MALRIVTAMVVVYTVTACATSAGISADVTTRFPDYALYEGDVTTSLVGNHIFLHDVSYVAPGTARLSCEGSFAGNYRHAWVSAALKCTNGIEGSASFGPDLSVTPCYSGNVILSNGSKGNLFFDADECTSTG